MRNTYIIIATLMASCFGLSAQDQPKVKQETGKELKTYDELKATEEKFEAEVDGRKKEEAKKRGLDPKLLENIKEFKGSDAERFQAKRAISLKDAVLEQYKSLAPKRYKYMHLMNDDKLVYLDGKDLLSNTYQSNTKVPLEVYGAIQSALNTEDEIWKGGFPSIKWIAADRFQFTDDNTLYEVLVGNVTEVNKILSYPKEVEWKDYNRKAKRMAYTIGKNLYVTDGVEEKMIGNGDKDEVTYGSAVHRHEFGVYKGTFWSPNGNYLAYYRMDERKVTNYPLVTIAPKPAELNNIKYPMAGEESHVVSLHIYNIATGKSIDVNVEGPSDQYLTNVAWGPNEEFVYIAVLNREQNKMDLNQYNAQTGAFVKTLFTETHDKYVEPEHPMEFIPGTNEFLWRSERSGFDHFYRYDTNGKLLKQVSKGEWQVKDFIGFDNTNEHVLFTGMDESGLNRYIYKANLKKGKVTRLGKEEGTHSASISHSGNLILNTFSSLTVPRQVQIIDWDGNVVKVLQAAEDPLKGHFKAKTELVEVKAKDGTTLHGRVIKPHNFDANKKYPVMVYVYGGPHVQLVSNRWNAGASLWMHYLANTGCIVFTLDSRGSDNRGRDFENATFRELGKVEMQDQLQGVEYLKSLPYVDGNRMGVHGWSFGGYMTTTMMLKSPETFKVGIAGGPVIDWKYYEIMYTERYMDTPQENPEGYKNTDLKNFVKNLQGDLLMIHGAIDDVVVWQHSMSFVKKCVDEGVQLDYFMYPEHKHNVRGKDRVHLMRKVTGYFMDNL